MRYVGSKNKISKELAPIIQKYIDDNQVSCYVEPFVGGANMIDKIKCNNKIGIDSHKQLVSLLCKAQTDFVFPEKILEDEYNEVKNNKENFEDWYVGLVGFCASFGAKYFGGYARNSKADNSGKWSAGAIRNLEKQRKNLKDVQFLWYNFQDVHEDYFKGCVIYCDPPYRNTTKYATENFPYEEFWNWCRRASKNNIVLISEYDAPSDFECIWSKEVNTLLDSNKTSEDKANKRIEKLFKIKGDN